MPGKRVLSIGQCAADDWGIARTLRQHFGAEVESAATLKEALDRVRQETFALVFVNRLLDMDGSSGLEIVRRIKADAALSAVPVMLVSNYSDAQKQAEAVGALPGFGKAALGRPEMLARVAAVLGSDAILK